METDSYIRLVKKETPENQAAAGGTPAAGAGRRDCLLYLKIGLNEPQWDFLTAPKCGIVELSKKIGRAVRKAAFSYPQNREKGVTVRIREGPNTNATK